MREDDLLAQLVAGERAVTCDDAARRRMWSNLSESLALGVAPLPLDQLTNVAGDATVELLQAAATDGAAITANAAAASAGAHTAGAIGGVAAGNGGLTAAAVASSASAQAAVGVMAVKAFAASFVVSAAGLGAWEVSRPDAAETRPVVAAAPSPRLQTAPAPAASERSVLAPSTPVDSAIGPSKNAPAPARDGSELKRELGLLREATTSLKAGDARLALRRLDEHAARYPQGILSEEREATRIRARCALGESQAAAALIERFRTKWPASVHRFDDPSGCQR